MAKIKTGIIGTGFIGPAHVEALRRLGMVEVAALAEAGQELAEEKAALLSIDRAYGDYRELLADPDIQVVHNCTPNFLHFEITKAALEAGKHVVSEKPLAMTSQESGTLVRVAKEKGVVNAIDFNYRYYALVQQAKRNRGSCLCGARVLSAGLALSGHGLQLAFRAGAQRRIQSRSRHRLPLDGSGAVHYRLQDRCGIW